MNLIPQTSTIHMYIDNEEIVCDKEFTVAEQLLNTSATTLNNCYPLSWELEKDYTSKFYFPKDYSKFELIINGVTVFRGVVKRSAPMNLSPFMPHFTKLLVLDYKTFLSEGNQLNFVLKDVSIEQAIERVLQEYAGYNFIVGNLNIGTKVNDVINNYNCNEKTPYDVLSYIADLTQSVWFTRYDGNNIAVDFYSYDNLPAGNPIIYSQEYFRDNSIQKITYEFDSDDYRNVQILTADEVQSNLVITNEFIVNGIEQTFILDEPVSSIETVTLAGENIEFGVRTQGVEFPLNYNYDSNEVVLTANNIAGTTLSITYYPVIAGRQKLKNPVEIKRIAEQQSNIGEIARYEKRNEAYTVKELGQIAQSYLYFKGKPQVTLEVVTLNNDMWNIGQVIYFENNGIEQLEDLSTSYIVKSKKIRRIQNNADNTAQVFYEYELINNFNFEIAVNYFNNQRAKNIGNINDGDFINRYIDFEQSINIIFNGFTTEELIVDAEDELEAELDFVI